VGHDDQFVAVLDGAGPIIRARVNLVECQVGNVMSSGQPLQYLEAADPPAEVGRVKQAGLDPEDVQRWPR